MLCFAKLNMLSGSKTGHFLSENFAIKKAPSGKTKNRKIEITLDRMHLSPAPAKGYFCDILKSNIFQPLFLPDTEAFVSLSNKFPGFAFFSCTSSNSFFWKLFSAEGHSIPFFENPSLRVFKFSFVHWNHPFCDLNIPRFCRFFNPQYLTNLAAILCINSINKWINVENY